LQRDSQRPDVATKLAEIAATQGKRDSFDKLAADIVAMDRTGEYKKKLAGIATAHFPGHPLAGTANTSTGSDATTISIPPVAPAVAALAATSAAAVAYASLDTPTAPGRASTSAAVTPSEPSSGSLDFVLDGMTIAAPTTPSVPPIAPSAAFFATPPSTATSSMPSTPGGRKSLEDDLAELEASLKKATTAGQVSESGMDFTDFSTATPTNLGTVGPSMRPEMLDLSFDAGRQGFVDPTPSILDGQWHDASTKLDLARAYEEMGDREGAREILREVIHDGDEVQITEAKAMLAKLGG
jgi:pilus assembly protein FimV